MQPSPRNEADRQTPRLRWMTGFCSVIVSEGVARGPGYTSVCRSSVPGWDEVRRSGQERLTLYFSGTSVAASS